jgi:predicted small integral membrane protein
MLNKISIQTIITRLFQIGLALIPAAEGLMGFLNDIRGREDTLKTVIMPLLSMQGVQPEFQHSWRAIQSPELQTFAYYLILSAEGLVGILGVIGLLKMLRHLFSENRIFLLGQTWARAACVLGILVWGLAFFVFAGDFFLAWQTPTLGYLQAGGLNYALIMLIAYVFLKLHEHSSTI